MKLIKLAGYVGAALVIAGCFMKWITVDEHHLVVTGMHAEGTNFGRPGYMHLILAPIFIFFHFKPNLWAKRANLAVIAINFAWAIRNYLIITRCRGGECPTVYPGIYMIVVGSLLMLVAGLFPSTSLNAIKQDDKEIQ